jgi:hypothetical protein
MTFFLIIILICLVFSKVSNAFESNQEIHRNLRFNDFDLGDLGICLIFSIVFKNIIFL